MTLNSNIFTASNPRNRKNKLLNVSDDSSIQFNDILTLCELSSENLKPATNGPDAVANGKKQPDSHSHSQLATTLKSVALNLGQLQDQVGQLGEIAPKFDSKTGVKGNGYRTFVRLSGAFVQILMENLVNLNARGPKNVNKIDQRQLNQLNKLLLKIIELNGFLLQMYNIQKSSCSDKDKCHLFPEEPDLESYEDLALKMAHTDCSIFYENYCGFHYKGDCKKIAHPIIALLASYSDYFQDTSTVNRLIRVVKGMFGMRYVFGIEEAAKKVFQDSREKPVEFAKSFYNLSEINLLYQNRFGLSLQQSPRTQEIKCNSVFQIPMQSMKIINTQGAAFQVPIPSSYLGPTIPLQVRLISPFRTPDMIGSCPCGPSLKKCSCQIVPSSDVIMFHLHGGGFVSHTSLSHTPHLKQWSKSLGIPILSIDYSLAPEAPFPRAVEETLYAYCWMRNNFGLLGTTGRKVIVAGDSAGANLAASLILQCIENSLPKPEYLTLIYPSLLCNMHPSPSRLITLIDPFVMLPCLMRCLNSYADPEYQKTTPRTYGQEVESCKLQLSQSPLLSPLLAPSKIFGAFPPTLLVTTDIDPCLDETVHFSNKLHSAGVEVDLQVFSGIPHGFLNLHMISKDCQDALDFVTTKFLDMILC